MTRRIRRILLPAASVLLAISTIAAQEAAEVEGWYRTAGFVRAHWDYPAKASVGMGVIARVNGTRCSSACLYQGVTFQGAGGIDAGELAIGYGRIFGDAGLNRWMLQRTYVGYGVRAAALRTWGSAAESPGTTFVGVEGAFTVAQFGLRLGLFRGVESSTDQRGWRVFGGAGWGF